MCWGLGCGYLGEGHYSANHTTCSLLSPAYSSPLSQRLPPQNVLAKSLDPLKHLPSSTLKVHLWFKFLSNFYSLGENPSFPRILSLFKQFAGFTLKNWLHCELSLWVDCSLLGEKALRFALFNTFIDFKSVLKYNNHTWNFCCIV